MQKARNLYQRLPTFEEVVKNFKRVFIYYGCLCFIFFLISDVFKIYPESKTLYGVLGLLIFLFGISLLKRLYKLASYLKKEGIISVAPGALVILQIFLSMGLSFLIIPIYLLRRSLVFGEKEELDSMTENQDKKSALSFGIIFLGWWYIVTLIDTFYAYVYSLVAPSSYTIATIDRMYSLIMAILGATAGFYILKQQNWARKMIIVLSVIGVVWSLTQFLPVFNTKGISRAEELHQSYKAIGQKNILSSSESTAKKKEKLELQNKINDWLSQNFFFVYVSPGLIWCVLICYYFTRPKVKEQFD